MAMAALLGGRIESLPEPRIHYYPIRSHASDRWMNAFALMGTSKILCSDAGGWAAMYNAEAHSFLGLPELKSAKGPRYVAASIPRETNRIPESTNPTPCIITHFRHNITVILIIRSNMGLIIT
jgi:hypothetical protein